MLIARTERAMRPIRLARLYAARLAGLDEAATVPMDHEAVPRHMECHHMVTAPVKHEAVFRTGAPSDMSVRAPLTRGLAGLFDAALSFLGFDACGRSGGIGSCTGLPAVIGSK
jgi:hypothetical protein